MSVHPQIQVSVSDLPAVFRESSYGRSLDSEDTETISVPTQCAHFHPEIIDDADLVHMLSTVLFWGLERTPVSVYRYCDGLCDLRITHLREQVPDLVKTHLYLEITALGRTSRKNKDTVINAGPNLLAFMIDHKMVTLSRMWTSSAAACGRIDCLRLLRSHGCPWNTDASAYAAQNGHLPCLQYLHEAGCPRDAYAIQGAASNGHLQCMKYLNDTGCAWTKTAMEQAIIRNRTECVAYMRDHGCPEIGV